MEWGQPTLDTSSWVAGAPSGLGHPPPPCPPSGLHRGWGQPSAFVPLLCSVVHPTVPQRCLRCWRSAARAGTHTQRRSQCVGTLPAAPRAPPAAPRRGPPSLRGAVQTAQCARHAPAGCCGQERGRHTRAVMCGAPLCPLPSRCPAPAPLLTGAEAHGRDAGAVSQRKGGHIHLVVERQLCRSGGCGAGRQLTGFCRRHGGGIGGGLHLAPGKAQHRALRAAQPGHLILGGPGGGRRARQGCWVAGTSDGGGARGAGRSLQAGPGCTARYLYAGTRRRSQKSGARAESNIFASGAAVLTSHSVARAAQQSVALLQHFPAAAPLPAAAQGVRS